MLPGPLPTIPILTAPTASGKTALALALAQDFGLEIVAADAFTVYRGLDIGTAKPTAAERQRAPHHLLDVVEVTDEFDVVQYRDAAQDAISGILERGRLPLVVGGTGFYLSALVRGLPLTPPADRTAQAAIEAEMQVRGLDALLGDIAARNPAEAARMERNPRRVIRALEVYRATGRFPGEFGYSTPAFATRVFAFGHDLSVLEGRIRQRTAAMLREGWPAEAQWLATQVPPEQHPRPTVWQALGYAEALALARGELTEAEATERITLATRQYAKRQMTWITRQLSAPIRTAAEVEAEMQTWLGNVDG